MNQKEDKEKGAKTLQNKLSKKVSLSPPWENEIRAGLLHGQYYMMNRFFTGGSDIDDIQSFIIERTKVHETYIKEKEKTKRITLLISALFLIASITIILFSPDSKKMALQGFVWVLLIDRVYFLA